MIQDYLMRNWHFVSKIRSINGNKYPNHYFRKLLTLKSCDVYDVYIFTI